jgi:hypothetical protein
MNLEINGAVLDKLNELARKSLVAADASELVGVALELLIKSEDKTVRMESWDGSLITYRLWK